MGLDATPEMLELHFLLLMRAEPPARVCLHHPEGTEEEEEQEEEAGVTNTGKARGVRQSSTLQV